MDYIASIISENASFFDTYGNLVLIPLFLIILIGTNSGDGFWNFGTFATPFFWGIGLLFHFLGVFGPSFIFGQNWEEKKIRKFMDNDKQEWK